MRTCFVVSAPLSLGSSVDPGLGEPRGKSCERTLQNVAQSAFGGDLGVRKQQVLGSNPSVGSTPLRTGGTAQVGEVVAFAAARPVRRIRRSMPRLARWPSRRDW